MRAAMRLPAFRSGAIVGLGLAVLFAILSHPGLGGLASFNGLRHGETLLLTALTGAYLAYLACCAQQRSGRIAVLTLWALASVLLLASQAGPGPVLLLQLLAVSGARSLFFGARPLRAFADLLLTGLAAIAAAWTAAHSGSPTLAVWAFFLLQALWPELHRSTPDNSESVEAPNPRFDRAHRSATLAIRQLTRRATR